MLEGECERRGQRKDVSMEELYIFTRLRSDKPLQASHET